jgi:iron complex outermembrane receptor protein
LVKIRIGYNGNISSGTAENQVDVLNAAEYRALMYSRFDSNDVDDAKVLALMGDSTTNWQDQVYQTAIGTDHNLYASGGIGVVPFRISLGYTNKEGILKTDHFEKTSAAVNLTPGFFDNTLQVNAHFKSSWTHNRFADRGAIGNALNFDPTQAIYDTLSPYAGFTTWTTAGLPNTLGPTNPVALLTLKDDESDETRYLTNLGLDYRIPFFPDLRANLNLAYDYAHGEGTVDIPTNAAFTFNATTGGGQHNVYEQTKKNSLLEFYLNYKRTFGDHSFDVLGGYSWQHFEVDNSYTNSDVAGTPSHTESGTDPAEYFLLSEYARLNYGFKDRYLLTLTLRRDGTSRFAPENRWGLFPAAALAVKLIENNNTHFNNLKVRLGWGTTGQQEIGDYYAYIARYEYGVGNAARYQFGDQFITTLRPDAYDENIKWEETETFNLGFDFSIINNRLSGSLDLYQRNTTDLLNRIPVPAGTNLSNFVTTNVGNMENKGIEIAFTTTPILTKKVTWDFGINGAYNHNEITKLTATDDPSYQGVLTGGIAGGVGSNIQIHSVGYAPRSFFVYKQLYDENGNIIENSFEDLNNDGLINGSDKYRFKKPAADFTLGFTSRLAIGHFDFSFAGRASIGNYVYNNIQTDMGYLLRLYGSSGVLWNVNQSAVDLNVEDQAHLTFSDHFVKKADFMKMDHITIGYNFDKVIGDFLRLYATVQNPLVITKYDGLDPEVPNGIDNNIYPRPRTILFGVNVEF